MANKLPVVSSVLYGEEERWAKDAGQRTTKKVITLKDMLAPQTVSLFTIHYDLIPLGKKTVSR